MVGYIVVSSFKKCLCKSFISYTCILADHLSVSAGLEKIWVVPLVYWADSRLP
jgi:hypothetical protein